VKKKVGTSLTGVVASYDFRRYCQRSLCLLL